MRRNIRRNVKHIKQRSKRNIRRRSSKKNVKRSVKRLSRNKKRSSRRSNRKRIINKKNRTNRRMRGGDDDGTAIPVVARKRAWMPFGETSGSYGGYRNARKMRENVIAASRDNTGAALQRSINNSDEWYVLDFLKDVLKKPLSPELRAIAEEKLEEQKKICHEWNQAIYYGFYDGWLPTGEGGLEGWKRVRGTGHRKDAFSHFHPYSDENFKKLHGLVTREYKRASNIGYIVANYLDK